MLARLARRAAATMPRPVDLTERRDARAAKNKKLKAFGPPSSVRLQVLGTGAEGAARALYVFTTNCSYLFNCGEGTQRLSHEHRARLARLENVFVTSACWSNVGGIPGALLTLNDVGVPALTLHGPPALSSLYRDTRSFIQLRGMQVSHRADLHADFVDSGLTVRALPLWGDPVDRSSPPPPPAAAPTTDYFAYERTGSAEVPPATVAPPPADSADSRPDGEPHECDPERAVSYAYLCSVPDRPGRLLLERCVALGVPPGPLLGRLKGGEDVTLADGTVVRSSDVTSPDEVGQQFLVVDVPSADFLASLSALDGCIDAGRLAAVVHFSPPHVMNTATYRRWLSGLPSGVRQVALNTACRDHGSEAVHRQQYQLHAVDPHLFPLLAGDAHVPEAAAGDGQEAGGGGAKRVKLSSEAEDADAVGEKDDNVGTRQAGENGVERVATPAGKKEDDNSVGKREGGGVDESVARPAGQDEDASMGTLAGESEGDGRMSQDVEGNDVTECDDDLVRPPAGWGLSLRPAAPPDTDSVLHVTPAEYRAELAADEALTAQLAEYRRAVRALPEGGPVYPRVVFLGTGSSIPNKKRNTSGILVELSEERCVMLDCGEGTYGQLVRLRGRRRTEETLSRLSAVYVSHMHADHHIGLIGLLEGRRKALGGGGGGREPCLLLAPAPIAGYLSMYHRRMAPLRDCYSLIDNASLLGDPASRPAELRERLSAAGLDYVRTCPVRHCPLSYGVRLRHGDGPDLLYSGDTRPCEALVSLGRGCDILIHEATHEDALQEEAELRAHCTVSEAIGVAKEMEARHCVLTHFSQRYASLPVLPDPCPANVGVASDHLVLEYRHLPRLPLMYPCLKQAFAEAYDQSMERTAKRLDKKLKQAEQLAALKT